MINNTTWNHQTDPQKLGLLGYFSNGRGMGGGPTDPTSKIKQMSWYLIFWKYFNANKIRFIQRFYSYNCGMQTNLNYMKT